MTIKGGEQLSDISSRLVMQNDLSEAAAPEVERALRDAIHKELVSLQI